MTNHQQNALILASGSPRRKQLLEMLRVSFDILVTDADEATEGIPEPSAIVETLARRKATAAAAILTNPHAVIVAADTLVAIDNDVLGKPTDELNALNMLRQLQGRVHEVYSGICAFDTSTGQMRSKSVCTKVHMRSKDDAFLAWYVATGEPMDKAGSYGIQGRGSLLVDRIEGDFYNVVGLPIAHLESMLSELGRPLSHWMR